MLFDFGGYFVLPFEGNKNISARFGRLLTFQNRDMRRSVAPIRVNLASGHYMHMEVRSFLSGDNSVVLDEIQAIGVVCL